LDGRLALHLDPTFRELVTGSEQPISGQYESPQGLVRFATMPVTQGQERGTFFVAYFADSEHAELVEVIRIYAFAAVGVLVVVAFVTWLSAGRLLRPIREVRRTAQQISETDLALRMPESGKDDVAELARTFNAMLDRLETAFATQREFLDDAGHELRTPITIVRGHLELLDVSDPADAAETRALLLDELDRMSRLVEDLIVLAKAERPDFLQIDLVDIGRLTDDVVDKARALGSRRWRIEARSSAVVIADRHRLTQALVQLAENAVKFSGPDDEVLVGSSSDGEWVRLWVRDHGPGVPPEHVERIFERFQRTAGADRTAGSGLGLAIVRAIAEAHGGRAWAESRPGRGATFQLRIPYATVVPPAIGEPEVVYQRSGPG
jgi:signal transduction histidine kinase